MGPNHSLSRFAVNSLYACTVQSTVKGNTTFWFLPWNIANQRRMEKFHISSVKLIDVFYCIVFLFLPIGVHKLCCIAF